MINDYLFETNQTVLKPNHLYSHLSTRTEYVHKVIILSYCYTIYNIYNILNYFIRILNFTFLFKIIEAQNKDFSKYVLPSESGSEEFFPISIAIIIAS